MIYRRCRCGKAERWDTGEVVHPCQGCKVCRSTLATWRGGHATLQDHDWEPRFNERTGGPDRRECRRCHAIERVEP
jgi:hypothetical protein